MLENYWNGDPLETIDKALGMAEGMRLQRKGYQKSSAGSRGARPSRPSCHAVHATDLAFVACKDSLAELKEFALSCHVPMERAVFLSVPECQELIPPKLCA